MSKSYRSKHEADDFAASVKKRAKTPQEVDLKGYHIASLYCEVHEYKSALHYAESYVAIKPGDPRGWKLVGFIYESLKNPAKAVQSYRRSLELNDYQKELVLKVAELYCDINYEAEKHRYWAERAEKYFPNHRIIHKIREHIFRASKNLKEYEKYLRDKLKSNPSDVYLNIKLVDILLETSQMREGYLHCASVGDSGLFESEPRWWQKAAVFYKTLIGQKAGQADSVVVQAYSRLLLAVNSLVGIGLAKSSAPPSHNMLQIQALDKVLLQMSDFLATVGNSMQRPQGEAVIQEVKGQFFFHLATLYLKMAIVGSVSLSDVVDMAAACYLASLKVAPYQNATKLELKKERMDGLMTRLRRLGAERMSEVGHMLKGLVDRHGEEWLEACRGKCCNKQGRQRLFEQVYGIQNPDPRQSFLMMDESFILSSPITLPDMVETVFVYDKASIEGGTTHLQRLVWLGLQWDVRKDGILPDLGSLMEVTFSRLALTTRRLDNTSVDNLCILDLEAFLYASVFIARTQLRKLHREGLASLSIPVALLVNCYSEEQLEWYLSVYQLYSGKAKPADLGKLRLTAKKGLEVLRCQKNHGIETQLLVELGRTFSARAGELRRVTSDPNDRRERREAYQDMSVLYWQAALEHLKMMASNRAVIQPKKPMFSHVHLPIEESQLSKLLDEGAVVIAQSLFAKGQHQVALSHLAKAKTADALFAKAMMLHNLASMETEGRLLGQVTSDMLKRQGDLLDQSKHTLYITMDTIDTEPRNPLHEEVQTLLEEIEQEQASILEQVTSLEPLNQSGLSNVSSVRPQSGLGDPSHSQTSSISMALRTPSRDYDSFRQSVGESESPKYRHAEQLSPDPSPRRLAAEVRALTLSHSHLLEQNQRLMQREDKLIESNADLMKQILLLTKDLQEVKLQQAKAVGQSAAPASVPATPPKQTLATPSPQAVPTTPQSQLPPHLQASRQPASPSLQQPPSRGLYQPHAAYHPLDSGAYYYPHMVPASPLPGAGGQAWYPSPYGVPSPMPNAAYYPSQQGYAPLPGAYDREGMVASTPRSAVRGPLESLYGMTSSIGASPEERGSEQMPPLQGLKQQQQMQSPSVNYGQKQMLVSGNAGAAFIQAASPQKVGPDASMTKSPAAGDKPTLMFKAGGSITSGVPTKSPGVTPPAMIPQNTVPAPAPAPAPTKSLGLPDRGIENVTPPISMASGSAPKPFGSTRDASGGRLVAGQQGMFKPDAVAQGVAVPKPTQPTAQPQLPGFGTGTAAPAAAAPKPSTAFGNISFTGTAIKPAASLGKLAAPTAAATATTTAPSPFTGFSFGITTTTASSSPSSSSSGISSAGVFKPAAFAAGKTPIGASTGVFGSQTSAQDQGFSASPKTPALTSTPQGGVSSAPRKPGQSPLATRDTVAKATDATTPKSVSLKPEIEDDDVIFVSMTQPPPEMRARAEKLQLPAGFYLYEQAPPCKGCIGCLEDLDMDSLWSKSDKLASEPSVRPKEPVFGSSSAGGPMSFGSVAGKSPVPSGGLFGGGDSSGGVSFAALAADQSEGFSGAFGKKATEGPFSFANAGAPVFGGGAKSHHDGDEGDDHGAEEEYDPHYEPIVSLPDIGKISTGEEDEEEMFRHRAKLYRYDRAAKAWKERGVGDIKILRNPKTGTGRVLMRRDQIFKLCANHWITEELELKPMTSSETSWVWVAVDFSEEEARNEQLAVKFKHAEDARRFRDAFHEAQRLLGQKTEVANVVPPKEGMEKEGSKVSVAAANPQLSSLLMGAPRKSPDKTEQKKPDPSAATSNPQLLSLLVGGENSKTSASGATAASTSIAARFAKVSSTWDCASCYINNKGESSICVACSTPRPGAEPTTSIAARFAKKSHTWDCDGCYTNNTSESAVCVACGASQPGAAPAPSLSAAGATGGATGGAFKIPAGFGLGQQTGSPSTGLTFGSGTSGGAAAGATFKLPTGFSMPQPSDAKEKAPSASGAANTTVKDGAPSAVFKLPSAFSMSSSPAPAPGASNLGDKDTDKPKEGIASAPSSTSGAPSTVSGATTPGGTLVTDKFTFGTGMTQFSFSGASEKPGASGSTGFSFGDGTTTQSPAKPGPMAAPEKPAASSTGFSFGNTPVKPPSKPADGKTGFSFGDAFKSLGGDSSSSPAGASSSSKPSLTLSDLAKTQPGGSAFSFRMDISEVTAKASSPAKSPGGRSPKTSFSRSPRTRTISSGTDQGDDEVEQGDDIYFEPIVQMPDDYEVKTGEEGEEATFSHRAKLFRYDAESKQWKERGVGDIKVLYNAEDHCYRIVMRREQVFKVCANHYVTPDLTLRPNAGSDRSWVWSAMDASEGTVQNEQLAVRFKTAETAKEFKEAVEKAKEDIGRGKTDVGKKDGVRKDGDKAGSSSAGQTVTPEIRSCDPKLSSALADMMKEAASKPKPSPSVAQPSTSQEGEYVNPEEERDIHFQPIVKLPDKVDLVTGEEKEEAMFVARGKLYRFDVAGRQWKERGVGDIKIMHLPGSTMHRIVMRREQIHKVCANHYITESMQLNPMSSSDRAWVWHAMDSADGEPTSEQLAIKFKDAATAKTFQEKFEAGQAIIKAAAEGKASSTEGATATTAGQDKNKSEEQANDNGEDEEEEDEEEDDDDDDDDDDEDDYEDEEEDDEEEDEEEEEEDEEDDDDDEENDENPIA